MACPGPELPVLRTRGRIVCSAPHRRVDEEGELHDQERGSKQGDVGREGHRVSCWPRGELALVLGVATTAMGANG